MTSRNMQQALIGCCAADSAPADRNEDGDDNKASKCNPASPLQIFSSQEPPDVERIKWCLDLAPQIRCNDPSQWGSPGHSGAGQRVWRFLSPTSHVYIPWFQYPLN